jgi:hypothetical protein
VFDRFNIPGTLEDLLADDIPVVTNYSMLKLRPHNVNDITTTSESERYNVHVKVVKKKQNRFYG